MAVHTVIVIRTIVSLNMMGIVIDYDGYAIELCVFCFFVCNPSPYMCLCVYRGRCVYALNFVYFFCRSVVQEQP